MRKDFSKKAQSWDRLTAVGVSHAAWERYRNLTDAKWKNKASSSGSFEFFASIMTRRGLRDVKIETRCVSLLNKNGL